MTEQEKQTVSVALDLESELSCSICTELLYQPLTLLDCLHTFCGSCLKEWFSWQRYNAESNQDGIRRGGRRVKYTCPACRARVRDTRVDAKVNTLLDMLLQLDPSKSKSEEEKDRIKEIYKPGDSVFCDASQDSNANDTPSEVEMQEENPDVIELLRQVSLADEEWQEQLQLGIEMGREGRAPLPRYSRRRPIEDTERWLHGIEHQPSLVSFLSNSDSASVSEREVRRHALEEGLLDGVDIDNLTPAQEDELTGRIAEAYRRRHRTRQRSRPSSDHHYSRESDETQTRRSERNRRPLFEPPPLSRVWQYDEPTRLRSASRHRSSSRNPRSEARSPLRDTSREAERPRTAQSQHESRPASSNGHSVGRSPRHGDDVRGTQVPGRSERRRHEHRHTSSSTGRPASARTSESTSHRTRRHRRNVSGTPPSTARSAQQARPSPESRHSPQTSQASRQSRTETTSTQRSPAVTPPILRYTEPSLTCAICNREDIQYEVHIVCLQCYGENWAVCNRCYLQGNGCPFWFGFGSDAMKKYTQFTALHSGIDPSPFHLMLSRKYLPPPQESLSSDGMTSSDPATRLQEGVFCQMCGEFADSCYWKCDSCNGGEWGFCNSCVNQGKCCTHSLLPIARIHRNAHPAGVALEPLLELASGQEYKPLAISTQCNICQHYISIAADRFHCPECENGDYDVCASCYTKLRTTSRIQREDGLEGWRRCLSGHRMVIIGYDSDRMGFRRVIVEDIVGGHALRDTHAEHNAIGTLTREPSGSWNWFEPSDLSTPGHRCKALRRRNGMRLMGQSTRDSAGSSETSQTSRFPPPGGVGLRVLALWSYYPEPHIKDEIFFPRGAEITEAENINNDWYWGCYAGQRGLFPGLGYVRVLEEVTGSG